MKEVTINVYTAKELKEVNAKAYAKVLERERQSLYEDGLVYELTRERAVELLKVCGFSGKGRKPISCKDIGSDLDRNDIYVEGQWRDTDLAAFEKNHMDYGDAAAEEVHARFRKIADALKSAREADADSNDNVMVVYCTTRSYRGQSVSFDYDQCSESFVSAAEDLEDDWRDAFQAMERYLIQCLQADAEDLTSEEQIVESLLSNDLWFDDMGRVVMW